MRRRVVVTGVGAITPGRQFRRGNVEIDVAPAAAASDRSRISTPRGFPRNSRRKSAISSSTATSKTANASRSPGGTSVSPLGAAKQAMDDSGLLGSGNRSVAASESIWAPAKASRTSTW